ncbi:MAG: hypothetical protein ACHQAX_00035 [Gammaproteobacteria bacterium]
MNLIKTLATTTLVLAVAFGAAAKTGTMGHITEAWCGYNGSLPAAQGYVNEGKEINNAFYRCGVHTDGYNYIQSAVNLAPDGCSFAGTPDATSLQVCHDLYTTLTNRTAPKPKEVVSPHLSPSH